LQQQFTFPPFIALQHIKKSLTGASGQYAGFGAAMHALPRTTGHKARKTGQ
jgi:hypothetical protein